MASVDSSLLGTFQKHVEDMRGLTRCKICFKPFYEPFILACGHTYCYSCLASWFGGGANRGSKKNCPDCRAPVITMPSPNYLLRDLVHMFVTRAELLPEDETVQEHELGTEEEAAQLAKDRAGAGLFNGVFIPYTMPWRRGGAMHAVMRPIADQQDNVLRCPECTWEIEDGQCPHCGWGESDNDDMSLSDEDDSLETGSINTYYSNGSEADQGLQDQIDAVERAINRPHARVFITDPVPYEPHYDPGEDYSGPDDSHGHEWPTDYEDEDEDDDEMNDFIDNDEDLDEVDEEDTSVAGYYELPTSPLYEPPSPVWNSGAHSEDHVHDDSGAAPNWPLSDSEANDTNSDGTNDDSDSDLGSTSENESEQHTNYDESDNEGGREATPVPQPRSARRPTRVIISDDEDDGEEEEQSGNTTVPLQPDEDQEEEESDDTTIPSQSTSRERRRHLNDQRARRANRSNGHAINQGNTSVDPRLAHTARRGGGSMAGRFRGRTTSGFQNSRSGIPSMRVY